MLADEQLKHAVSCSGRHCGVHDETHRECVWPLNFLSLPLIPRAQTLKNLVLGGVASFTVVDDAKVAANDMGNNFMVGPNSLGEPRAKVELQGLVTRQATFKQYAAGVAV